MTSTIGSPGRVDGPEDRLTDPPAEDLGTTGRRPVALRRRPVTRSVRGRRTVVVPAERLNAAELAGRVPFVVVLLVVIGAGVGGTLLLSAQTTQDTYRLQSAREANVELTERVESLQASNERARSAEVLAQRAETLGMVGVASAPILTRGSDGVVEIVGEPVPELGAPIRPLQPAPVPSESSRPSERPDFDAPPAQAPQDRTPRGVAPVPYPPVAGPPSAMAPPPAAPPAQQPAPADPVPADPVPADPVPAEPAPAADGPATLAPVPGQPH